jgi:hypothetical protein
MTTPAEREALIEAVLTAHRPRDPHGEIRPSAAFHDLDADGRAAAFDAALEARAMEAALDPDGLSTTARAVLARIRGAR